MNKRQIISSLINNANNLDNSGFYKEANILTKLAYDILPEDIIMPGEQRININNTTPGPILDPFKLVKITQDNISDYPGLDAKFIGYDIFVNQLLNIAIIH